MKTPDLQSRSFIGLDLEYAPNDYDDSCHVDHLTHFTQHTHVQTMELGCSQLSRGGDTSHMHSHAVWAAMGAIWGSLSCSRTPRHVDLQSLDDNSPTWASAVPAYFLGNEATCHPIQQCVSVMCFGHQWSAKLRIKLTLPTRHVRLIISWVIHMECQRKHPNCTFTLSQNVT